VLRKKLLPNGSFLPACRRAVSKNYTKNGFYRKIAALPPFGTEFAVYLRRGDEQLPENKRKG